MTGRFRSKTLWPLLLLPTVLILGMPLHSYPGGFEGQPPVDPATERLTGPAITGMVMITPANGGIDVEFTGRCGPVAVSLSFEEQAITFAAVNVVTIKNFIENHTILAILGEEVRSDCYPPTVIDGRLIVIAITRFLKDSTMATADLVIMAAISKL